MSEALIVFLKTVSLFLLILVGWWARRRDYLTAETSRTLSRFVVDFTFPALVFPQMLRTIDPGVLRECWYFPVLAIGVLGLSEVVGLATMRFFCRQGEGPTFLFCIAMANWIYLPLPIVQGLYGDAGVRAVLLFNVGAQVFLWTAAVWTLRAAKPSVESALWLAKNPGLIATVLGIAFALWVPGAHTLHEAGPASGFPTRLCASVVEAMALLGSLTIPLSFVVTGAQLGELKLEHHRPSRAFMGVMVCRLALAPIATVAAMVALAACGIVVPEVPRLTAYIIAAMPVAVSCSIITERLGGDTPLAARTIFYSTFASILTMPVFVLVVRWGGW